MATVLFKGNGAPDRVAQIDLTIDHIEPGRTVGILKIGHERGSTAIERVDDHLAISRPGDLYTSIQHVMRLRRDGPFRGANMRGLGQKIGHLPGIEPQLASGPQGEQFSAALLMCAMQLRYKFKCRRRQYLSEFGAHFCAHHNTGRHGQGNVCCTHDFSKQSSIRLLNTFFLERRISVATTLDIELLDLARDGVTPNTQQLCRLNAPTASVCKRLANQDRLEPT